MLLHPNDASCVTVSTVARKGATPDTTATVKSSEAQPLVYLQGRALSTKFESPSERKRLISVLSHMYDRYSPSHRMQFKEGIPASAYICEFVKFHAIKENKAAGHH